MKLKILTFLTLLLTTIPAITLAQDNYLVGIPGVTQGESTNFDQYIQAVYVMFISIAALLAVVKIIIAGVKYMFTDIVTQKGEAKKDIQGAVFGLLIVLSAVLILTVINPELTRFNPELNTVNTPEALPLSAEDGTTIQDYCNSIDGECVPRSCDALDDYVEEMMIAGAAAGLILPPFGPLAGILVGGATGLYLNYQGSQAECEIVCAWLSGEVIESTNTCLYPEDALQMKRFEIANEIGCDTDNLVFFGGEVSCSANTDTTFSIDGNSTTDIVSSISLSENAPGTRDGFRDVLDAEEIFFVITESSLIREYGVSPSETTTVLFQMCRELILEATGETISGSAISDNVAEGNLVYGAAETVVCASR